MLAIVGESGAGKSTLLHILGALDRPSQGDIYCAQLRLRSLSPEAAADFRNREIGYVWQFHYLLPELTAIENVLLPARNLGLLEEKTPFAKQLLEELGIGDQSLIK
jgi:lipoprotein-releasing system ATP-binding protein